MNTHMTHPYSPIARRPSPDACLSEAKPIPLSDATDFVSALRLIGQGIMLDDKGEGRAIAAAAWSASHRLEDLRAVWTKMLEAARRMR